MDCWMNGGSPINRRWSCASNLQGQASHSPHYTRPSHDTYDSEPFFTGRFVGLHGIVIVTT